MMGGKPATSYSSPFSNSGRSCKFFGDKSHKTREPLGHPFQYRAGVGLCASSPGFSSRSLWLLFWLFYFCYPPFSGFPCVAHRGCEDENSSRALNARNTEAAPHMGAAFIQSLFRMEGQEDKQQSDASFVTRCN